MKVVSKPCISEFITNYHFHTILLEAKTGKKELLRLKQDPLKLKRESKANETNKPCEVVSLKSKNKMSLKEIIREEKKDSDSINGEKKSNEVKSGEKKIRMRKEESVENIGKHLSFNTKLSEIKNAYFFLTYL